MIAPATGRGLPPEGVLPTEPQGVGLVRVMTPDQNTLRIDQPKTTEQPAALPEIAQTAIAAIFNRRWQEASQAKQRIQREMVDYLRQSNSEYSPQELQDIEAADQPNIFARLSANKARTALAMINDILNPPDPEDKPYDIDPTPIADLPPPLVQAVADQAMQDRIRLIVQSGQQPTPEDMQAHASRLREMTIQALQDIAKQKARNMALKIDDQLTECKFSKVLQDAASNMLVYHNGFIKGPLIRKKAKKTWSATNGYRAPIIEEVVSVEFSAPHPMDIFVTADSTTVNDGTIFHRMRMTRSALVECRGIDGFDTAKIDETLTLYYDRGVRGWTTGEESERALQQNQDTGGVVAGELIDVLDASGKISGQTLIDDGILSDPTGTAIIPWRDYEVNVWMVKNAVLFLTINPYNTEDRNIYTASYEVIPGSFWGRGLMETMKDKQAICNASVRATAKNAGLSAGPMYWIDDIDRLPTGEDAETVSPHRIFQFTNEKQSTNPPMGVMNVPDATEKLLAIYDKFAKEIDDDTGIPRFEQGNERTTGAARTMGGLAMLMNASARGLRQILFNIDQGLLHPAITNLYHHNMQYDDNMDIKGDARVVARGAMAMVMREQLSAKRTEFLQLTANPIDLQIMGPEGRAVILRSKARELGSEERKAVPDTEELAARLAAQQEQALQQQQLELNDRQSTVPRQPRKPQP